MCNERIKIRINQLEMMYPDTFHEMSEEKKAGLVFYKDDPGACLCFQFPPFSSKKPTV